MASVCSKMAKRLRSACGETLVETLAAVMVCALSVTMLLMAIVTATANNAKATEITDDLAEQRNAAAAYSEYLGAGGGAVGVTATDVDNGAARRILPDAALDVDVYGGDDIASYLVTEV